MSNRSRTFFGNLGWFLFSQEMEVKCYIRPAQTHNTRVKIVNKFTKKKQEKLKGRQFVSRLGKVFQQTDISSEVS
jgi:predicted transcriptional regulator